jgi:hypothetical protein
MLSITAYYQLAYNESKWCNRVLKIDPKNAKPITGSR